VLPSSDRHFLAKLWGLSVMRANARHTGISKKRGADAHLPLPWRPWLPLALPLGKPLAVYLL